jgi:hypothetical protein
MDDMSKHYTLKEGSVRPPKEYLGLDIAMFDMTDHDTSERRKCWSIAANTYIKRAVNEVKLTLAEVDQRLKSKVVTPLAAGYQPEVDATPKLDSERTTYFQGLIGVLRWLVELGRVDIMVAVTMLSSHMATPRQGQMEQALQYLPTCIVMTDQGWFLTVRR